MDEEAWRGAVIYQIYPRSFQDTTGSGTGDLPGITRRLGHVADLGADWVWLSPIFASPMRDMGYDVSDHLAVDPSFGTEAEFDAMVAEAHRLGLKVMLDQVLSHSSDLHPFFAESRTSKDNPKADWYVWADPKPDGTPPNNWQAIFGGPAWAWEPKRRQYYFHNFLVEQPDFDFHNPEVRAWAVETLRFWQDRGVDGFRLDAINHAFHDPELRDNPVDTRDLPRPTLKTYDMQFPEFSKNRPEALPFMAEMRRAVETRGGILLGEIGELHHPIERLAEYTSQGRLHMGYHPEMLGARFDAAHFRDQVERLFALAHDAWPAWAFSNHDVPRHVHRWADRAVDQDALAKLCCALLLSLPGAVCLYQGEELGLGDPGLGYDDLVDPEGLAFWPENPGRDGARTPMPWEAEAPHAGFSNAARPWLPVKPDHAARAVDAQADDPDSVLSFYRRMVALRRARPELRHAPARFLDAPEPVLAFTRGTALTCAFNLGRGTATLEGPEDATTLIAGNGATVEGRRVTLPGNGFALLAV